jgi:2-hydroxy-6-oxonona-2,4-dienedioate hydrolase/2-hydroxy-6-oxo-6-(2'-carboxyphenyl)-hexa-2,4-dienoate hydrolase
MPDASSVWLDHLGGGRITHHDAGAIRTRALDAGDTGPVVVLLHGVGGHAEAFVRNIVPLGQAGFRAYAIDMLGHGETAKPDVGYSIADYVAHLRDFVACVSPDRPVHVVGESLGGWVALRAALDHPDRIERVVSVVGAGLRPVPPTEQEREGWAANRSRTANALDDFTFDSWRSRLQWLVHDPASMPDEMVRVRMALYALPGMRDTARKIYAGLNTASVGGERPELLLPEDLAAIAQPTLYLWTDHNPTTPASVAEQACALTPHGQFALMEGCGHWPQYESPEEFNRLLVEFLRG